MLVGDQIKPDPQSGDVVIRNRRRAAQRALGNIEAFIGTFDIGDRAGGIDRDQHRRTEFGLSRNRPFTKVRYRSVSGTTSNSALTSLA